MRVALVACGPTSLNYVENAEGNGSRYFLFDEVWTVNAYGSVLANDLIFHMDDLRVQEKRAEAGNAKIANMLDYFRRSRVPIITSRKYPEYPSAVEFPLEEIINFYGICYFNSTPSYALAYAGWKGVKELSLFGVDYTMPNSHIVERGRACCEFWVSQLMCRGIQIKIAAGSTLLDQNEPPPALYGYDSQKVSFSSEDGKVKLQFEDKELPSAEEMEQRYDHGVKVA